MHRRFEMARCMGADEKFLRGSTLLVVSPSEYQQSCYCQELEGLGYQVSTSAEVPFVVEQIHRDSVRLCIVEVDAQSDFACWLLGKINESDELKSVPVIVIVRQGATISTFGISRYPVACFYSRKPSANELDASIRHILKRTGPEHFFGKPRCDD